MKKHIFILFIASLLLTGFQIPSPTFAADYAVRGAVNPSLLEGYGMRSPLRDSFENYHMNGTYNEPRGTYFHQGTDHRTWDATRSSHQRDVYAVRCGKVHGKNTGTGNRYIIIKHDCTPGIPVVYTIYMHLSSVVSLNVGDDVNIFTKLGVSGDTGAEGAPHLHWEVNTTSFSTLSSSRVSIDMYPYLKSYYGATDWAKDSTFFKEVYNTGQTVYATIYGMTSGTSASTRTPSGIVPIIYYQYDYSSTWGSATMSSLGGFLYSYTIPVDPVASSIKYTLKATYGSNYAFAPAVYRAPDSTPTSMQTAGHTPGYYVMPNQCRFCR